jgi:hypothetical protein
MNKKGVLRGIGALLLWPWSAISPIPSALGHRSRLSGIFGGGKAHAASPLPGPPTDPGTADRTGRR